MRRLKPIEALFPKTRQQVLTSLFLSPEKWWYLNELASHLNTTASTLQVELKRLTMSGILEVERRGSHNYFRANRREPYFDELRGLIEKTGGIVDVVMEHLRPFQHQLEIALIYGSIASGTEHAGSDVDLLIVTEIGLTEMAKSLRAAERLINREINTFKLTKSELLEKIQSKSHFFETIKRSPQIVLFSRDNELEELLRQTAD